MDTNTPNQELYDRKLDRLFQDGTLVQVQTGVWSMRTALSSDDLLLAEGFQLPDSFRLGVKLMLPVAEHSKLTSVVAESSQFMRANSWEFPIANAHFVPNRRLLHVLDKLQGHRAKFQTRVDDFLGRYPALQASWLANCSTQLAASLLPLYPSEASLRRRFRFDVIMFEVSMPKHMRQVERPELEGRAAAVTEARAAHRQAVEHMAARNVAQLDAFVQQAINGVRLELLELFRTMEAKLRSGEVLQATSLAKLRRVISTFQEMDFTNNEEIQKHLLPLAALLETGKDFQEDPRAIKALKTSLAGVTEVVSRMSDLDAATGAYFRNIS